MLGQQNEPLVNNVLALFPLSVLAPTVEGGASEQSSSAIDAGVPKEREEIVLLEVGEVTGLDAGFVRIKESIDNALYTELCVLPMTPEALQTRVIQRKGRYLKATLQYEFVQEDDENPVASSIPLTLQVLR